MIQPFRLVPEFRDYLWGGERLRPGYYPTAEAWVVYENDRVAQGEHAGRRLSDLAEEFGERLLGRKAAAQTGKRFPLLIKLLDCNQWLSLQVHPDDEQAARLAGAGNFGKTEAWYVLEAQPEAEILCGLREPVSAERLEELVHGGRALELCRRINVRSDDAVLISPGTLHALGPGLLVYEVQQTSDLTYRVWDWDRPASAGRKLHLEESLAVIDPASVVRVVHASPVKEAAITPLAACRYFQLELVTGKKCRFELDTNWDSFHILTGIEGEAYVSSAGWEGSLRKWETLLAPAECKEFSISIDAPARFLHVFVG